MNELKILLLDVETAPLLSYTWDIWDQNIALNQIYSDWHLLSWSAKWYTNQSGHTFGPHSDIMYQDQRNVKNIEDDKKLLKDIWNLLNEADVIVTQNGKKFDSKKLNARFILNGYGPPSPYRHIDTLVISKKHFAFTSHKLEYMTKNLCEENVKSGHKKFPGFELWKACLENNIEAWKEMQHYNEMDVLSLEELYHVLAPWDSTINFNVGNGELVNKCNCGSTKLHKRGYNITNVGHFQRYQCRSCGKWTQSKINLLSKEKKEALRK
jgi:hypothetical protein